jgi:hypothetical protein
MSDTTNITPFPKDRTNAERQRRYRERRRGPGSVRASRNGGVAAEHRNGVTPPLRNQAVVAAARAAADALERLVTVTRDVEGTAVPTPPAVTEKVVVTVPIEPSPMERLLDHDTVVRPPAPAAPRSGRPDNRTPAPARPVLTAVLYCAALALASVSGGYSITGLTSIFVGAFWPVIAMGIALEAGKLCAVAAVPTLRWGSLKGALIALVAVLMGLNAVGCYGFLARAQIEHAVISDATVEAREAQVQAKLDVQAGVVADLEKRIGQIDAAVMTATLKGRTRGAMQIADDQKRNRADLVRERQREADTLAEMKAQAAGLSAQRRVAAAELGPVRYLAALLGAGDRDVLRWFILVVAMLLDPAAVLLLLAAASGRK